MAMAAAAAAAAVNYKLLFALLILSIPLKGAWSQSCTLLSIEIQQRNIDTKIGFDTTFEVEVKNRCHYMVTQVFLYSRGFASSVRVDPKLFREVGRHGYLVNDGKGIQSFSSVNFTYAWDHYFMMTPKSFEIKCK